ncbi:hypothetical protein SAMN05444392_11941 [Seinonella peptonophila]|uniref:Uncharacterized protein n=1 Tax=Seinonella peptonophila TaxID=112248 RepID=A0A1M5B8F9_9BACL|nr:hypothetical protein [Seinonella peptonophila]SHF38814.1 hypothetical protein SAMN05444392_11941 [Seinonella peptonophila]
MIFDEHKQLVESLSDFVGEERSEVSYSVYLDRLTPVLKKIKEDESIVFIKMDGERKRDLFTFLITGKALDGNGIRMDTDDFDGGMSYVCIEYARKVWNWDE